MVDDDAVTPKISPPVGPGGSSRKSQSTSRLVSSGNITRTAADNEAIRHPDRSSAESSSSAAALRADTQSQLEALIGHNDDFTLSPEQSPGLEASNPPLAQKSVDRAVSSPVWGETTETARNSAHTRGFTSHVPPPSVWPQSAVNPQSKAQKSLTASSPSSVSPFNVPATSKMIPSSATVKARPKVSKLNTLNILNSDSSSSKPVSPGVKHWEQVRAHVMAPTPIDERPTNAKFPKKLNLVSKAAGRFGFKQAAENVLGYNDRRNSSFKSSPEIVGLSAAEQEEIQRERRKFARDVKACLDACALEETKRRLQRSSTKLGTPSIAIAPTPKSSIPSVNTSQQAVSGYNFDPNFSSFAPLLMELHRHLPAARARKLWSRTCPYHSAILSELGVCFLRNSASSDGERQQALEVFGMVVRNWASDSAEEELDRWMFLCQVISLPDKQLRNRGIPLLTSMLNGDQELPVPHDRPDTAGAWQILAMALMKMLYDFDRQGAYEEHRQAVKSLLLELIAGYTIDVKYASLKDIIGAGTEPYPATADGLESELLWLAVARAIRRNGSIAGWIMDGDISSEHLIDSLALPFASASNLKLRSTAITSLLASLTFCVRSDPDSVELAWQFLERLVFPQLDSLSGNSNMAKNLGCLLFQVMMGSKTEVGGKASYDHRTMLAYLVNKKEWSSGIIGALRDIVKSAPILLLLRLFDSILQEERFSPLAGEGISALTKRLQDMSELNEEVRDFLRRLQRSHPQLLYKSLFALSASTNITSLQEHLRSVRNLSSIIGRAQYWTHADPQMVVIVLIGNVPTKNSNDNAKDNNDNLLNVKSGRYACLIEFIIALDEVQISMGNGDNRNRDKENEMKVFVEKIEERLGMMLDAEEKRGHFPPWYKALLCQLFLKCRYISLSPQKTAWHRLLLRWYTAKRAHPEHKDASLDLRPVYKFIAATATAAAVPRPDSVASPGKQPDKMVAITALEDELLDVRLRRVLPAALLMIHSSLSRHNWLDLLPRLWQDFGVDNQEKVIGFLLSKCGELVPDELRDLISSQANSANATDRRRALHTLVRMYGWRYQILSQVIITNRRGPIFQFPARVLDFVATEIGSPVWSPPHDIQDAALKKFGTALPVELRQRLMELGWSDEEQTTGRSEWEQIPVSLLPSLSFPYEEKEIGPLATTSPSKLLRRTESTNTRMISHGKKRMAIFPPVLISTIHDLAVRFSHDPDSLPGQVSRDLIRLIERDDPSTFLRPFTDGLSTDFRACLVNLNAIAVTATPAFAYSALNAIVGYLKTVLRSDATFGLHASALATVSILIPRVSGMSLRDIRKYKAEHVLLPASIHEEHGGFKLHAPWRDGAVGVQTAQLLILNGILRVNPREVYLMKKILSNLPVKESIAHRPFARAWLILVATLFSTVNRNYNDRAELRYLLTHVGCILRTHEATDVIIVSLSLRIFMLCSARFRRLFASTGFSTVLPDIFGIYAQSKDHTAVRDGVECACKSFYRIHKDLFVHQACIALAEDCREPEAAYAILASLSMPDTPSNGASSGLRGLNDSEEIAALVQMISKPELTVSEIGTDAAERTANKLASVDLGVKPFPKENIVRLLVTIIAANPATQRGISVLRLFGGMIPLMKDQASLSLVRDSLDALGDIISKGKVGDEAAQNILNPAEEDFKPDWSTARIEYIKLVEVFAHNNGAVSPSAARLTLDMAHDFLRRGHAQVGPIIASAVREMARTHLNESGSRSSAFLRDIAPVVSLHMAIVDFSALLNEMSAFIRRTGPDLDKASSRIIVHGYLKPAIRLLAASGATVDAQLRVAIIDLLSVALFLPEDAMSVVEALPANEAVLSSIVLPLCLQVRLIEEAATRQALDGIWIRLLQYAIQIMKDHRRSDVSSAPNLCLTASLAIQVVKVILLRGSASVTKVDGLWSYIAQHLTALIGRGDGRFTNVSAQPRLVDWLMWSLFEMISLHQSPLMIHMRHLIQTALSADTKGCQGSTPSSPSVSRMSSHRSPSFFPRTSVSLSPGSSPAPEYVQVRRRSWSRLSPLANRDDFTRARLPSQSLSPILPRDLTSRASDARPTFTDLTARGAAGPSSMSSGGPAMPNRFPSSQTVRQVGAEKSGGAIIHLLGAPHQVPGVSGTNKQSMRDHTATELGATLQNHVVRSEELARRAMRAVNACRVIFGVGGESEETVKMWSTSEAIQVVEESRLLVEKEFAGIFVQSQDGSNESCASRDDPEKSYDYGAESDLSGEEDGLWSSEHGGVLGYDRDPRQG